LKATFVASLRSLVVPENVMSNAQHLCPGPSCPVIYTHVSRSSCLLAGAIFDVGAQNQTQSGNNPRPGPREVEDAVQGRSGHKSSRISNPSSDVCPCVTPPLSHFELPECFLTWSVAPCRGRASAARYRPPALADAGRASVRSTAS